MVDNPKIVQAFNALACGEEVEVLVASVWTRGTVGSKSWKQLRDSDGQHHEYRTIAVDWRVAGGTITGTVVSDDEAILRCIRKPAPSLEPSPQIRALNHEIAGLKVSERKLRDSEIALREEVRELRAFKGGVTVLLQKDQNK